MEIKQESLTHTEKPTEGPKDSSTKGKEVTKLDSSTSLRKGKKATEKEKET